jgi:magnesium transporter
MRGDAQPRTTSAGLPDRVLVPHGIAPTGSGAVLSVTMQLIVLSPDEPPRDLPRGQVQIDTSDSTTLTWIDLDRTETPHLPGLVASISVPLARDLLDPSPTTQLRERGGYRWLSLLGVGDSPSGLDLADLDVILGPGLLITVHTDERPALRRLGVPARWRRPLAPPLSEAALGHILDATLDAYDDLVDGAEEEVQALLDGSTTRDPRARSPEYLRLRRRMLTIRRQLASQRDLFAQLARPRPGSSTDGLWRILDRLETAIAGAQGAADYALAASWSMSGDSRRRTRDLGLILIASWVTLLAVGGVVRLTGGVTSSGVDPILFAGGVLALATLVALVAVWSRRWN